MHLARGKKGFMLAFELDDNTKARLEDSPTHNVWTLELAAPGVV
jgi:hypothetical protein